jgi:hypothetical protein
MSFLVMASSALTLGFLHGLGADHLIAIAALTASSTAEGRSRRIMRTAIGFAAGHAAVLGAGAMLAVTAGLLVPAAVSSGAERAGGAMLVVMGTFGLWSVMTGRAYAHVHDSTAATPTSAWHLHLSRATGHASHTHGGSTLPLLIGALFAISSLRMVMLLQPFSPEARTLALPGLLALIALFGVGILISMSLFGVVLARVLSLRAMSHIGRAAAATIALASIGLGFYWMG